MTGESACSRWLVRALVASLTLTAVSSRGFAQAANAEPERQPLVRSVALRGVTKVDREQLAVGLFTKGSRCKNVLYVPICLVTRSPTFNVRRHLDPVELRRDELRIRLFYWRRGYRDAVVSTQMNRARGGVRIVFNIQENEPTIVESILIRQTDSVLPSRVVDASVQLRANDPLNLVAMDSSIVLLQEALWERGYADGIVELDTSRVDNTRNAGPVTLMLDPGPRATVHAIQIEGNQEVSDATIARLLRFRKGDLYRRSVLLESQRDLYLSGLFSEIEMGAQPSSDSAKIVDVRLTEAPLRNLEFTSGFTTADFLQFEANFTRYNVFGGARRMTLRGTVSNLLAGSLNGSGPFYDVTNGARGSERDPFLRPTWAASVEFSQPWFLAAGNQLGASIFTHRRSVPGVVTDRGFGGSVALTRDFAMRTNGTLGYTYEASTVEASDLYFCVTLGLCVQETIRVISRRHPLAPVAFVTQYDRTNHPFTPNRGVRARLDVEHASNLTASDYAYHRAALTASKYFRTSPTTVLAGRVRLGIVRALSGTNRSLGIVGDSGGLLIHPRKLFFSGGSQSVRGYGENQLGPRVLTIDPAKLTDPPLANPCTSAQLAAGNCNPNQAGIRTRDFQPRPLGGTSLAEASVEYRFPISFAEGLTGAVFVDGAIVATRRFANLFDATSAITPGFGVRFNTPVGPVRLDMGVRPTTAEDLPVITQVSDSAGTLQLVTLTTKRRFDQAEASGRSLRKILSRLTLHLAIGPAF
ncbi:MAG: BamA/OMP85 family outer membrane protein [Gemmatimonadaceae bacterium]